MLSVTTTEGDIKVDGSLKSGGMLNLDSTGNITVTAGHIESGGSAYLFAKNNLEFLADEDPLGMNNVVSTLTVGGNLFTDSGGDTTLQATDVSVAELAYIKTGGDLNLTTVTDKSDYTEVIEDGNTTTVRRVTEEKERGVNLTVGDNLFIESGSDLNMTAANLDVEGAASISAINDVNIMAGKHTKVTEEEVTTTEKEERKGGSPFGNSMLPSYSTKTTKSETTETMNGHVGSNINVGGGLSISAGQKAGVLDEESDDAEPTELVVGNINIEGSTIAAGGDLNLLSTGTIDILSKKTTVETNGTVMNHRVFGISRE